MSSAQETITSELGTRAQGTRPGDARLVLVIEGEHPLEKPIAVSLRDVDVVEIGRGAAREIRRVPRHVAISVADGRVSTAHAKLTAEGDGWVVVDAGSKNGMFLNGTRVLRGKLAPGDTIRCGEVLFMMTAGGPPLASDGSAAGPVNELASFAPAMADVVATVPRIARGDIAVLVHGETGAGKEIVASAIHELSGRRGRFVAVNCAALPATLFEAELFGYRKGAFSGATAAHEGFVRAADDGTLLLDEIGELRAESQAALLRMLEQGEVVPVGETTPVRTNARIIAATNVELEQAVHADEFRRDLFARLAGFVVRVPPLRARLEDLGLLVAALLRKVAPDQAAQLRLGPGVVAALAAHRWPDNIRELRNALHAASLLATDGVITVDMLPPAVRSPAPPSAPTPSAAPPAPPADDPQGKLEAALARHAGNLAAVARELGKDPKQIRRWLEMYGIDVAKYRG
ncbi:MAG: sigma 54-interacting transcriptional regulator [Deltaproteobacteria bacterium]|nr:sigma 54-interacting transcriptional regulator [Deltaproteobacteria bacterium]